MGRPKKEEVQECNYEDITKFINDGTYPNRLTSDANNKGEKKNFRRMCLRFCLVDGVLHYLHSKADGDQEGELKFVKICNYL